MAKQKDKIEPHEKIYKSRQQIFLDNIIGGIAWGVGSVVGATLVISMIGFLLARLENFPFIGDIAHNIVEEIGGIDGE